MPPGTRSVFLKNPFDHSGPNGRRILRGLWAQQRPAPRRAFQEKIVGRSGVFHLPFRSNQELMTSVNGGAILGHGSDGIVLSRAA